MNEKTSLIMRLAIFCFAAITSTVLADGQQESHFEEKKPITCVETSQQNCEQNSDKPELETIKLSPTIRYYEPQQSNIINSNELAPFVRGSDQVR